MAILGILRLIPDQPHKTNIFLHPADEGAGARQLSVMLHELSSSGVLIESRHRLFVDEDIHLVGGPNAHWSGRVVWAGERLYACRFDREIEANALMALLADHRLQSDTPEAFAGADGEESLGLRLQRLRIQRGFTQSELAEKLGVSTVAVSYWESGRSAPRRHRMGELSQILGVSEEQFTSVLERYDEVLLDAINASKRRIARVLDIDPSKVRINVEI